MTFTSSNKKLISTILLFTIFLLICASIISGPDYKRGFNGFFCELPYSLFNSMADKTEYGTYFEVAEFTRQTAFQYEKPLFKQKYIAFSSKQFNLSIKNLDICFEELIEAFTVIAIILNDMFIKWVNASDGKK